MGSHEQKPLTLRNFLKSGRENVLVYAAILKTNSLLTALANENLLSQQGIKLNLTQEQRDQLSRQLDDPDGVEKFLNEIKQAGQ